MIPKFPVIPRNWWILCSIWQSSGKFFGRMLSFKQRFYSVCQAIGFWYSFLIFLHICSDKGVFFHFYLKLETNGNCSVHNSNNVIWEKENVIPRAYFFFFSKWQKVFNTFLAVTAFCYLPPLYSTKLWMLVTSPYFDLTLIVMINGS